MAQFHYRKRLTSTGSLVVRPADVIATEPIWCSTNQFEPFYGDELAKTVIDCSRHRYMHGRVARCNRGQRRTLNDITRDIDSLRPSGEGMAAQGCHRW